jgi:hypothetical protein
MNDGFLILLCILFLVVVGGNMLVHLLDEFGFWQSVSNNRTAAARDTEAAFDPDRFVDANISCFNTSYWRDKEIRERMGLDET